MTDTQRGDELHVIAGLMSAPRLADDIADMLVPDDIQGQDTRRIYECVMALASAESPPERVDAFMVMSRIYPGLPQGDAQADADLKVMLGLPRVHAAQAMEHVRAIRDRAQLRKLMSVAERIRDLARVPAHEADESIREAQELMVTAFERAEPVAEASAKAIAREHMEILRARVTGRGKALGISTGLKQLDTLLAGGLRGGHVYLLGADTGGGKTAFACHLIRQAVLDGRGVLQASLEVPKADAWERLMSAMSGIPSDKMLQGMMTDDDVARYMLASARLANAGADSFGIIDSPTLTPAMLERAVRRRMRRTAAPLGMLVVDYAQLMEPDAGGPKTENREQAVGRISKRLLGIAQRYKLAALVLTQLNRDGAKRQDKRPVLTDARESSRLVHDASVVIFLHPAADGDGDPEKVEVLVRKNRMGPTGSALARYRRAVHTFEDYQGGWVGER